MASILAFVQQDDEVVIIEPFYDLYIPAIQLAGGRPVIVPMQAPTQQTRLYSVDWQEVRKAITYKTKMMILNFPHNPTGIHLKNEDRDDRESISTDTGRILLLYKVLENIFIDGQIFNHYKRNKTM